MMYLTNDALDQAVYFDLRRSRPQRQGKRVDLVYFGLLGNGVHEVDVTLRKSRGRVEIDFGPGELFGFVEESVLRRLLGEAVATQTLH